MQNISGIYLHFDLDVAQPLIEFSSPPLIDNLQKFLVNKKSFLTIPVMAI
jgi:hypothetical protein